METVFCFQPHKYSSLLSGKTEIPERVRSFSTTVPSLAKMAKSTIKPPKTKYVTLISVSQFLNFAGKS